MHPSFDNTSPLAGHFSFWKPRSGHMVHTGADERPILLPEIPLPLPSGTFDHNDPADDLIGSSLYDYLRQFPDCPHNIEYATLLRDVWPHYLSDLASQAIMLDHKVVDAPYVQRKIISLKILLLLNPGNPGLLLQLGLACNDFALMFSELHQCRTQILQAMDYFLRVQQLVPGEAASLNGLAQIDYLLGDYPSACKRWQELLPNLQDPGAKIAVQARLAQLSGDQLPDHPLLDDLEATGVAMLLLANNGEQEARDILERLDESGLFRHEFPSPEFFCLLAASRERTGDPDAARIALLYALELDPDFALANAGLERLLTGGTQ